MKNLISKSRFNQQHWTFRQARGQEQPIFNEKKIQMHCGPNWKLQFNADLEMQLQMQMQILNDNGELLNAWTFPLPLSKKEATAYLQIVSTDTHQECIVHLPQSKSSYLYRKNVIV